MGNSVISMRGLCKSYKKQEVLHDFSLTVERGHICGLIGPNGAGKTTIMKILAGFFFPTKGELELFGSSDNLDDSRARMSFMIEQPIIAGPMTARQNLEYIRCLRGYPDEKRIDEILDIVGLANTGKKRASKFSLGMKQRLGIANALMCDPEMLVLDEPVNGLDPAGIHEIRELLLKLNQETGVTILISSHILTELEHLCTDYLFIGSGNILERTTAEELERSGMGCFEIKTTDNVKAFEVVKERFGERAELAEDMIKVYGDIPNIGELSSALFAAGAVPLHMHRAESDLEKYYLEKVLEGGGEGIV